jgi:hypothetical protein
LKIPLIEHYSPFEFNDMTKSGKGDMKVDLLRAKYSEEIVEEYLNFNNIKVIERDSKHTGKFDFKCDDGYSYEIKDESYNYDSMSGNIALEIGKLPYDRYSLYELDTLYRNDNYKKSSISISESDYHIWHIKLQNKKIVLVKIGIGRLRWLIDNRRIRFVTTNNPTGNLVSFIALIKIETFLEYCADKCFLDMSYSKWKDDYIWDKTEALNLLTQKEKHD